MKLFLAVLLLVLAFPARATDVDFYGGLEKAAWDGGPVRLLAIYPYEPPADATITEVWAPKETPRTRHGALLAYALLADGHWLQEALVRAGKAIVMPVYETDWGRLYTLKNAELAARLNKAGVWAKSPVVCADRAKKAFDSFAIVQGRVKGAANVRGTIYLNFGEDYRTDYTVKITRGVFKTLPEAAQGQLMRLTESANPDMVAEARGWVFYSGGPMIEIKTAAQLDFYRNGDPFIEERC